MAGADPRFEDGSYLVKVTNSMLSQLHVPERVKHWSDINAHIFLTLFEGISGEPLRDIVRQPKCREDEIHNVQVVIDTLSLDILHVSLSHITGEDVVGGHSKRAVGNLVEVILSLLEFILEGIGSDLSSISDSTETEGFIDDPSLVTGELIDEILGRQLNDKCQISHDNSTSSRTRNAGGNNSTNDLIALGKSKEDSRSVSFLQERAGNTTAELIEFGKNMASENSYSTKDNTADLIALGLSPTKFQTPPTRDAPAGTQYAQIDAPQNARNAPHNSSHLSGMSGPAHSSTQKLVREGESVEIEGQRERTDWSLGSSSFGGQRNRDPRSGAQVAAVSPTKNLAFEQLGAAPASLAPSLSAPDTEFDFIGATQRSVVDRAGAGGALVGGSASAGVFGSLTGAGSNTSITHHLYHHFDRPVDRAGVTLPDSIFSGSLPLDGSRSGENRTPGLNSITRPLPPRMEGVTTLPAQARSERLQAPRAATIHGPGLGGGEGLGKSHSYDNLQNLMQDTVALSRAAVRTSPLRHQAPLTPADLTSDGPAGKRPSRASLERLEKVFGAQTSLSSRHGGTRRVTKPDHMSTSKSNSPIKSRGPTPSSSPQKGICSPSKATDRANKKVSFHVRLSDESQTSLKKPVMSTTQKPSISKPSPVRSSLKNKYDRPISRRPARPRQSNTSPPDAPTPTRHRIRALSAEEARTPLTLAEYMDKYYGTVERRDRLASSDGEERGSPHSDSNYDISDSPDRGDGYVADADVSEDVEAEISRIRRAARLPKSMSFDNIIDASAPGRMGGIRRKLGLEDRKARTKAQALAKLYEMELGDLADDVDDHLEEARSKAKEQEKEYKSKVLKQPKINNYRIGKKQTAVLRPRTRTRSSSAQARGRKVVSTGRARKRSASASPAVGRRKPRNTVRVADDDLLPWLLQEFPFLHLSTETLHELWRKSTRQIQQLTKTEQEVRRKKSKAQVQVEESERKHTILMDIMKKELAHNERMKELKERRTETQSVRTQLRARRQQSARARRYYDEYQVRARAKMLKKSTREELVFKRLFKEGLDVQKDRIRDLRRYAKEERERRAEKQRNDLESIENYYRDQFSMLTEALSNERQDLETREKAQSQVVGQMKQELRRKMEREIRRFQEQIYRDEDDEYFRQLDADRLRQQLQLSRYQASV